MTAPKKRVNSRRKGAEGELELAKVLTDLGYPARRGQQFKGGAESPDVVCEKLKAWHIEVKRTATSGMHRPSDYEAWMAQAIRDSGSKKCPVIMHRWNGARDWWVLVITYGQTWYWQRLDLWLGEQPHLLERWGWK